ncbi:MAG: terpene cyclase/mutase family protein [Pirellulaceae bacterium]|nr:terpene cyclase/mutase family protein [Pirellulaceae bacterium]
MSKFKGDYPAAENFPAIPKISTTSPSKPVSSSGKPAASPAATAAAFMSKDNAAANGSGAGQSDSNTEEERPALLDRFTLLLALPSFLISLIVHVLMTAVAALIVFTGPQVLQVALNASNSDSVATDEMDLKDLELSETELEQAELSESIESQLDTPTEFEMETPNVMDTMPLVVPDSMASLAEAVPAAGSMGNDALMHRNSGEAREQMLKNNGGTAASEAAVELGLKWLANHQLPDGSWDLNHQIGPGRFRQTPDPGVGEGKFGATGLALLPFLGKGYTHMEGKYQGTVRNGLAYLIRNIKLQGANGGSYMDARGNMYSHAICTICLCEAFGMTKDPKLREPAALALRFIVHAQDPIGGGWRYLPQQAGDTSAVGWQLMALKSGSMMGEQAPPFVFERTKKFLNFVQSGGGTRYGYTGPSEFPGRGTTSVGVLSRMYLGWNKENETLKEAVAALSAMGPDTRIREPGGIVDGAADAEANMYYNYYTTQIMRHYGGEPWEKWNETMREFLIKSQSKEGFSEGSWFFANGHSSAVGGRLYTTAMAVMTLEVYYRHLPLYRTEALEDEFPLD